MKTIFTLGAAVLVVVAVGTAWHASRLAHEADDALAVVTGKAASAEAEIHRAERRLAQAESARAELQTALARWQKTNPAGPSPVLSRSVTTAVSAEELERKLADARQQGQSAAAQQFGLEEYRAGLVPGYRQFFEKLGLSPAQIDRFVGIAMKGKESGRDLSALIKQGIVAENDPVVEKMKADIKTEMHSAYRDLLGESGFQQFQEFARTGIAKDMVKGYAGMALIAGAPVTAAQIEQLAQIVAHADSSGGSANSYTSATIDWDLVDAQARPILSDEQWAVFRSCYCDVGFRWAASRSASAIAKAVQADAASKAAQMTKSPTR